MRRVLLALLIGFGLTAQAHATEWRLGLAYVSGLGDVTDLYEQDLRAQGRDANVDLKFPLGLSASFTYDWLSGVRADVSLGPAFAIQGDVDHFEMPLGATVGYNFMRDSDVSPYVRGGLMYHFASGDLYSKSKVGPVFAAGLDFTHFTIEVAVDRSEVEFDTANHDSLNTYDVIASVLWRFRAH
ncbi:MAG TPA: outer membrane beta-barrel protein [Steroidobacteraceae bacterium]|nr:outer membrane beta-barrel protein [Steroidobacteraceae bacterium]